MPDWSLLEASGYQQADLGRSILRRVGLGAAGGFLTAARAAPPALLALCFLALTAPPLSAIGFQVDDLTHWDYHLSAGLVSRSRPDRISLRLCRIDLIKVA